MLQTIVNNLHFSFDYATGLQDSGGMKTKNEILEAVEDNVQIVNRYGCVVSEGFRTENWSTGFRLSDDSVILFEQVSEIQIGKVVLK